MGKRIEQSFMVTLETPEGMEPLDVIAKLMKGIGIPPEQRSEIDVVWETRGGRHEVNI